jgi:hypothetical protein
MATVKMHLIKAAFRVPTNLEESDLVNLTTCRLGNYNVIIVFLFCDFYDDYGYCNREHVKIPAIFILKHDWESILKIWEKSPMEEKEEERRLIYANEESFNKDVGNDEF